MDEPLAPKLKGARGEAYEIDVKKVHPAWVKSGLALWFLHSKHWHPAWEWWMVGVIHLREVEGEEPPHKDYPEAAYEIAIVSLDPDYPPPLDEVYKQEGEIPKIRFLMPPDLIYQFHGVTDEQAAEICGLIPKACIEGGWSPDSDYRTRWNQSLDNTVAHYQQGVH